MAVFSTRRQREEVTIALCRVLLLGLVKVASLAAVAGASRPPEGLIGLLHVYLALAALYAFAVWSGVGLRRWLRPAGHALDLGFFAAVSFSSGGTASPLLVVILFAMVTATVRWQWRGVAWIGAIALLIYVAAGAWAVFVAAEESFDVLRFLIRTTGLLVLTLALGFLGRRHEARQVELASLFAWPQAAPETLEQLLGLVLPHVAGIFAAPGVAFEWRENGREEARAARWAGGSITAAPVAGAGLAAAVPAEAAGRAFLWSSRGGGAILYEAGGGLRHAAPQAVTRALAREGLANAVAVPVAAASLSGWLIVFCDRPPSADRLNIGGVVARLFGAQIDQLGMQRRLRQGAVDRERARMARDVHDGVAQSLAVAVLRLHAAGPALASEPERAARLIAEAEGLVRDGQRALRELTDGLLGQTQPESLATRVRAIADLAKVAYGIPVRLELSPAERELPPDVVREAAQLVREALTNAGRHSGASQIGVSLEASAAAVRLRIRDDGRGLSFTGRRDLAALIAGAEGPRAIRERVLALGGTLTIDSSPSGTELDITIPGNRDET